MTDERRSSPELSAASARLLAALGNVASDLQAAEALSGLGDRARSIVAELARGSRLRTAAEPERAARPEAPPESPDDLDHAASGAARDRAGRASDLPRRLEELRACVSEVADVLEATTERLGTIEMQLGDPDTCVEQRLSESIERCEQVLMGIEHRVFSAMGPAAADVGADDGDACASDPGPATAPRAESGPRRPTVLVVASSSTRRSALCIDLEKQGLDTVAATDLARALAALPRAQPAVALLVAGSSREACTRMLEDWTEREELGGLPPAAVILAAGDALAADEVRTYGMTAIHAGHGAAALAAALLRLARNEDARS